MSSALRLCGGGGVGVCPLSSQGFSSKQKVIILHGGKDKILPCLQEHISRHMPWSVFRTPPPQPKDFCWLEGPQPLLQELDQEKPGKADVSTSSARTQSLARGLRVTEVLLSSGYSHVPAAIVQVLLVKSPLWWPFLPTGGYHTICFGLSPTRLGLLCCQCGLYWLWITASIPSSSPQRPMLNKALGSVTALGCQEVLSRTSGLRSQDGYCCLISRGSVQESSSSVNVTIMKAWESPLNPTHAGLCSSDPKPVEKEAQLCFWREPHAQPCQLLLAHHLRASIQPGC